MKKIMFMMMPLFLTALIFGAGCDQDPSTDKDKDNSGGGDVVADVTMQASGNDAELSIGIDGILSSPGASVTEADWKKAALKTVRFVTAKSQNAKGTLKVPKLKTDETYPVFVPAGKTLILSGDGEITATATVVVEGNLYVENGSLLVGSKEPVEGGASNFNSEGRIVLRNGVLRLYEGATLAYGSHAKVTSIGKGDKGGVSALKNGGIEFRKGSWLDITGAQSQSNDFILKRLDPNTEDKYITLDQVYQYSAPASVFINQGELTSDYIIDFPVSTAYDRVLVVNGGGGAYPDSNREIFTEHSEIIIPAGLVYMNIRSDLEHKDVIVNGALAPMRKVYAKTLTVAPGAGYAANESNIPVGIKEFFHVYNNTDEVTGDDGDSGWQTDIDNGLNVSGIGDFEVLKFTESAGVTVNAGGTVTIGKDHTFNYSPVINGLLELKESATLNSNRSIEAGNGGNLLAGDFKLNSGILSANSGTIEISVAGENGNVLLNGNSTFEVRDRLDVGEGTVSVGSLAWSNANYTTVREDALTLNNITLKGAFTLTGGTESATISATTPVTIVRVNPATDAETETGELTGDIVFRHGTTGAEGTKRFLFTADTLFTNGYESSLVLGSSGEIMYDGVSLSNGTYYVTTDSNETTTGFAIGQLSIAGAGNYGLGIGIGREGVAGNNTRLVLDSNSIITFAAPLDKQAYLLAGQGLVERLVSFDYDEEDKWPQSGGGTETSPFAIIGTQGSIIKIDNVIIAGSLGHVTADKVKNPVPLFAYDGVNLGGTAATGSLTVVYNNGAKGGGGGSLSVDHNYTWTYTDHGWVGTKPTN
jgi:hypothetical protein